MPGRLVGPRMIYRVCGWCNGDHHDRCLGGWCMCHGKDHAPTLPMARSMARGRVSDLKDTDAIEAMAEHIITYAKEYMGA